MGATKVKLEWEKKKEMKLCLHNKMKVWLFKVSI